MNQKQRGLLSHIQGERFENLIATSLTWYRQQGLAEVEKTPEPMRPLSKSDHNGRFLACFTKAAQPDFQGTLNGGRSVVFEAKHSDSDRIEQKRVTEAQWVRLDRHDKLGAVCFVLVSLGNGYYRVPWFDWVHMQEIFGHKHIKQAELEVYKIPCINGVLRIFDGETEICRQKETFGT